MEQKILCTGTLIVDIINDPVAEALGPNEGINTSIGVYAGGNAFNVSADLTRLGVPAADVTCLGACGSDFLGDMFVDELGKLGIRKEICRIVGAFTAKIFILKVKAEKPRYYLDEGVNALLTPEFISACIENLRPAVFYSGEAGHLPLVLKDFPALIRKAKRAGCLTIVDTVIPPSGSWEFLFKAASFIDCLKCNQYEARSLTGRTDMNAALAALEELRIPLTVISLAQSGLLVSYNNVRYKIPAFKVENIDSVGAGDAFMAGMIAQLSRGERRSLRAQFGGSKEWLLETILFASACGAQAVTARGCLAGVEKAAVLNLLREQEKRVRAGIESF